MWYPQEKEELEKEINKFLAEKPDKKISKINGLIVPQDTSSAEKLLEKLSP